MEVKNYVTENMQASLGDIVGVADPALYVNGARPFGDDPDGWLFRATAAAACCTELSADDFAVLRQYFSVQETPRESSSSMPADVVANYKTARDFGLFEEFVLLSHPTTHEALLVGIVRSEDKKAYRVFMIGQWGKRITTIKKLRSWRYRASRQVAELWRESGPFSGQIHGAVYVGIVLLVAIAGPWALFALTSLGWWVFVVTLVVAFVLVGWHLGEGGTKAAEYLLNGAAVVNAIAAVVVGLVHLHDLNTENRTQEVLVCRVSEAVTPTGEHLHWRLHTPEEVLATDPGTYEGTYYESPRRELVDKFVGKWVKVTAHGYIGESYVTELHSVRTGSCG